MTRELLSASVAYSRSSLKLPILWVLLLLASFPALAFDGDTEASDSLRICVVDRISSEPISAADVRVQVMALGKDPVSFISSTDTAGRCMFADVTTVPLRGIALRVQKPGYAGVQTFWRIQEGENPPAAETLVKLEPGISIGGVVRGPNAELVTGAVLEVFGPRQETEWGGFTTLLAQAITDAEGQWTLSTIAGAVSQSSIRVRHPDYETEWISNNVSTVEDLLAGRHKLWLKAGFPISGRVTQTDGKPVAGAQVTRYVDLEPRTTIHTDREGSFTLAHIGAEETVTVRVDAPDYPTTFTEFEARPVMATVQVYLVPGRAASLRIVDPLGKPISGAVIAPSIAGVPLGWAGKTNEAGRVSWNSAPATSLNWLVAAPGYKRHTFAWTPHSEENITTLVRPLVVSGDVADATTGDPVKDFRVLQGLAGDPVRVAWDHRLITVPAADGTFRVSLPDNLTTRKLVVLSPDHLPYVTNAILPGADSVTTRILLKRAPQLTGRVTSQDGTPVTSAAVGLATDWNAVFVQSNKTTATGQYPIAYTGSDGTFSFPPQLERYTLAALHASGGYTEVRLHSTTTPVTLALVPWARLEGRVAHTTLPLHIIAFSLQQSPIAYSAEADTDDTGRFQLERLRPGDYRVCALERNADAIEQFKNNVSLTLTSGNNSVALRTGHATVTGQLDLSTLESGTAANHCLIQLQTLKSVKALPSEKESRHLRHTLTVPVETDGRFRFSWVPEGEYFVQIKAKAGLKFLGYGTGRIMVPQLMPDSQEMDVDVGTIALTPVASQPGQAAPEIDAVDYDGHPVKLSDFRGKWVVVDFWADWCKPCVYAMTNTIKPLWEEHRKTGRIAVFSISVAENPSECQRLVKELGFNWSHGWLKVNPVIVQAAYGAQSIPMLYLVDPDGNIAGANLTESGLRTKLKELVD